MLGIGATERPITSPYLKYKVMVGLNADTNAGWSQADADLFVKQVENPDEDMLSKAIRRRWRQKDRLPGLMFYKAEAYIGNYFDYFSTLTETEEQANFTWNDLPGLCRASMLAISVLTLMGAVKGMLDRRNEKLLLTGILLAGYVLAYLLIEVQTRYAQVLMPMMTMLAGYGGCVWKTPLYARVRKKTKRRSRLRKNRKGAAERTEGKAERHIKNAAGYVDRKNRVRYRTRRGFFLCLPDIGGICDAECLKENRGAGWDTA